MPSLPDIPQPGPHPVGVPCGGAPVIPLTGGSEHSQILLPQYSMTGTQCLLGPELTNVGEGNAKQGKGIPIQRASSQRHPHGSTRHGHIHRAHGGACQSTRGCDLCTPTWSRWEDLSLLATRRHAHAHAHTCTRFCTCRQRGQCWLCLGLTAKDHHAGEEKVSHTSTGKTVGQIAFDEPKHSQFPPSGKAEGNFAIP